MAYKIVAPKIVTLSTNKSDKTVSPDSGEICQSPLIMDLSIMHISSYISPWHTWRYAGGGEGIR